MILSISELSGGNTLVYEQTCEHSLGTVAILYQDCYDCDTYGNAYCLQCSYLAPANYTVVKRTKQQCILIHCAFSICHCYGVSLRKMHNVLVCIENATFVGFSAIKLGHRSNLSKHLIHLYLYIQHNGALSASIHTNPSAWASCLLD